MRNSPINITRLSPRQKAYVIGFRRGMIKGLEESRQIVREELHGLLKESVALKTDFAALAARHMKAMHDRAVDEAVAERSARPGQLLH